MVTGASGNAGANIVDQLLGAGEQARDPARHPFPVQVEVVVGDLTRPDTLPGALTGIDRAFLSPRHDAVDGFLEAARQVELRQVVLLSSAAVTHATPGPTGEKHLRLERAAAASRAPWTEPVTVIPFSQP